MAKTKNPFLSFEAHGSIGDSLTAVRRRGQNIVESKPTPHDPFTLPQQYQRWLYEDYIYLWHQLSNSWKLFFRKEGSKVHLTGFAYYMKDRLSKLPDIILLCHLDARSGNLVVDHSRNLTHGTVNGATPVKGVIDNAYHFDGLNDFITFGNPASMANIFPFTFEMFVKAPIQGAHHRLSSKVNSEFLLTNANSLRFDITDTVPQTRPQSWSHQTVPANVWTHIAATYDGNTVIKLYINGVECTYATQTAKTDPPQDNSGNNFDLGHMPGAASWLDGNLDHYIWYNRQLSQEQLLIHSKRRYPHPLI